MKSTVIICTHNRCCILRETLESLISQVSGQDNCNIVVVDNASNDGTGVLLAEFEKQYEFFTAVHEPRKGKQWALNRGISCSTGDLLIFADDDVRFGDGWLSSIYDAVAEYPQCRVFGGKIVPYFEDGSVVPDWVCREHPYSTSEGPLGEHDHGDVVKSYYDHGLSTPFGANMFLHRSVFDDYGLVSPVLFGGGKPLPNEDSILGSMVKRNSEEMLYIPSVVVHHVVDSSRLDRTYFRMFYKGAAETCVIATELDGISEKYRIFNVPRWFYVKFGRALLQYILSQVRFERKDIVFSRELQVVFFMKVIAGFWRKRQAGQS